LSKEEIKNVRKNLREYSRAFEEADLAKRSTADRAVIEGRRRQLDEWLAWRQKTTEELSEEREDLGLPEFSEERRALIIDEQAGENEGKVVEEIFEEILEESEEILD
jgi:translation initiation factor 3 subunit B